MIECKGTCQQFETTNYKKPHKDGQLICSVCEIVLNHDESMKFKCPCCHNRLRN